MEGDTHVAADFLWAFPVPDVVCSQVYNGDVEVQPFYHFTQAHTGPPIHPREIGSITQQYLT